MTLLVSWSAQVLDSWAEHGCYLPAVAQMYFKWGRETIERHFLNHQRFSLPVKLPRLWLWYFCMFPAMQMAAQRTGGNLFSLTTATIPATSHVQVNFTRNSGIFYTRANPEGMISILLFGTIKSISHSTKPQCNLFMRKPFFHCAGKDSFYPSVSLHFLLNLQAYFNQIFTEKAETTVS